ncbi:hypothetical protein C8R43DRAFT_954839 [Mycena crocata]|nr:hypothetical protein C8R43DRAFT_954839 [Mycena crocata]
MSLPLFAILYIGILPVAVRPANDGSNLNEVESSTTVIPPLCAPLPLRPSASPEITGPQSTKISSMPGIPNDTVLANLLGTFGRFALMAAMRTPQGMRISAHCVPVACAGLARGFQGNKSKPSGVVPSHHHQVDDLLSFNFIQCGECTGLEKRNREKEGENEMKRE